MESNCDFTTFYNIFTVNLKYQVIIGFYWWVNDEKQPNNLET